MDIPKWLQIITPIAAGISILISVSALLISFVSQQRANKQFTLLNQGYLHVTPVMGATIPNNDMVVSLSPNKVNDDLEIQGLSFHLDLQNIGNLPIEYDVDKLDIFLNDKKYNKLKDEDNTLGVLYPKQKLTFQLKTTYFDLEKKPLKFKQVKDLKIKTIYRIKYQELNTKQYKYIDREVIWEFHDNMIRYIFTEFNDEIS